MGFYRYARLAFFSKEAGDRQLFRLIKSERTCRIVELGIGSLERTLKALTLAIDYAQQSSVRYTGFDLFDERTPADEPLSLIAAHRELSQIEVTVRLAPGGATTALPAMANSLADTDLVLISANVTEAELSPVWFFLPRMCHPGTQILRETAETGAWEAISLEEISRLAVDRGRAAA